MLGRPKEGRFRSEREKGGATKEDGLRAAHPDCHRDQALGKASQASKYFSCFWWNKRLRMGETPCGVQAPQESSELGAGSARL